MKPITYYRGRQIFWFRIFGYGLSIRSLKHGYIPFSIRYGIRGGIKVFDYYLEFLKPDKRKYYDRKRIQ